MTIIRLKDRIIYRAEQGKKVRFKNREETYCEIAVKKETDQIEEVIENV